MRDQDNISFHVLDHELVNTTKHKVAAATDPEDRSHPRERDRVELGRAREQARDDHQRDLQVVDEVHLVVALREHGLDRRFVENLFYFQAITRVDVLVVVLALRGLGLGLGRAHDLLRRRCGARSSARRRRLWGCCVAALAAESFTRSAGFSGTSSAASNAYEPVLCAAVLQQRFALAIRDA